MNTMKKLQLLSLSFLLLTSAFAQWEQVGLDIDGEAEYNYSGRSVSLSSDGTIVAIGADMNNGNGASAGHVRVYFLDGANWTQRGQDIDGEAAGDQSGWSVSLSSDGSVLAIGALGNDENGNVAGQVRVYYWNGSNWIQRGLDIDGEAENDQSGFSVSLSSDGLVLAIGTPRGSGETGYVRVYYWNGSNWLQRGQDFNGDAADSWCGSSVSLSSDGSFLVIGASGNPAFDSASGPVRVYYWDGTNWVQKGQGIDSVDSGFGRSVSLSSDGSILAIGSPYSDGNGSSSGEVRIYYWDGSNWMQRGLDIDGEAGGDQSGMSVSLCSDGSVVAISALFNDGNGNLSGHVRVYNWNGTNWTQSGSDIDGEATEDWMGWGVSLSSDGLALAIGATQNDGNGLNAGHVRVYNMNDVGITEQTRTELSIYPNPAKDFVVIESKSIISENVQFYNIQGQLVEQFEMHNSKINIQVSDWNKGIYLVKIANLRLKLIKE